MTATASDTIAVVDPRTGEAFDEIPAGSAEAVDAAVAAARDAFPGWSRTQAGERAGMLKAVARAVREHAGELAELSARENGKPLNQSHEGVLAGAGAIEQYAELGPLHRGRSLHGAWEATDAMVPEPYGVAALLVPWNDPMAIAGQNLAALLVTGNTVVFKPSEKTPLSGARLAELFAAELPPGVVELLQGDGRAGAPLVEHPDVSLVVHTGSVATGRWIAETCGRHLKKAVLELGGKDAFVVDAGIDPAWAAAQAASGSFMNAGQVCVAAERIYVHEEVAEAFLDALVGEAERTEIGPLVDERQRELVARHVEEARAAGAEVRCGGEPDDGPGFFYPPTVVRVGEEEVALMRDETFGPVAAVQVVPSFDAALEKANASPYGLAATVLTPSLEHAQRAWRELRAGTVKINSMWGGAPGGAAEPRGVSGIGSGYGPELLDEVTRTKVIHVEPAPGPPADTPRTTG
jgi:succinate-semialdehyde dehydrogenase/glutarate-semialdehyde dehydrogenase